MSATTDEAIPATGTWEISTDYSNATFTVRHHGVATFRSSFGAVGGSFDADAGHLSGHVPVANLEGGPERLKTHILIPEWFDAERFPTMNFESTSIRRVDGVVAVEGELTIRGVTRPVVATGTWNGPQTVHHHDGHTTERLGLELTTTIDRRDFGLAFNSDVAEGVLNLGWAVKIEAALQLVQ